MTLIRIGHTAMYPPYPYPKGGPTFHQILRLKLYSVVEHLPHPQSTLQRLAWVRHFESSIRSRPYRALFTRKALPPVFGVSCRLFLARWKVLSWDSNMDIFSSINQYYPAVLFYAFSHLGHEILISARNRPGVTVYLGVAENKALCRLC